MQEVYGQRAQRLVLPFSGYSIDPTLMQPLEIFVDDETKLTLHGLQQHYVKLEEVSKNKKLSELLDTLEFNQVMSILLQRSLVLISPRL